MPLKKNASLEGSHLSRNPGRIHPKHQVFLKIFRASAYLPPFPILTSSLAPKILPPKKFSLVKINSRIEPAQAVHEFDEFAQLRGINGFEPWKRGVLDSKSSVGGRKKKEGRKEGKREEGGGGKIAKRAVHSTALGYLRI